MTAGQTQKLDLTEVAPPAKPPSTLAMGLPAGPPHEKGGIGPLAVAGVSVLLR